MPYPPGTLVRARNREWMVLPESQGDLLLLRPLGGSENEATGIYLPLEKVEPASFRPPTLASLGDHRSGRLLRDALRLGLRAGAGPFRSFAKIAVEPRPYQLVPLLLALRQEAVRLLIGDDVGIGKTVEALLIARELLERGDARRLAVLCPPHLAEQWQREMREKFHLEAELVLASTIARLERGLPAQRTIFEEHEVVVISTDLIKSERHRLQFLRSAPELVIVDEAHTCAPL
ncbi:MAG: DEAD/DEAH box helicase family protein, partial [Planctomycetes bacterium]|nr:DEAD/DEAH box helicase family protein [Planctomycetota bacterium]